MSEEEKIEELAKYLTDCFLNCASCDKCRAWVYSEQLYNAGYRKQSEGEWKMQTYPVAQCSLCGLRRNVETQDAWKFCPNCGAKLKGGAE